MATIVIEGSIPSLLLPGLNMIMIDTKTYKEQFRKIFKTAPSEMAFERDVEMSGPGLAMETAEGAPFNLDGNIGQKYTTSYLHKTITLGFIVSHLAENDNLYTAQFELSANILSSSFMATEDTLAATVLNNAFTTPIGDGQPLASISHPINGGVVANTFNPTTEAQYVDFSESGVEQALIKMQRFRMQSGILNNLLPTKLVVDPQTQFSAIRLLQSQFRTDTANNDINAINNYNYIPEGFIANQYIQIPNFWMIMSNYPTGFRHFEREKLNFNSFTDPATRSTTYQGLERLSFGVSNFRACFVSRGTS